MKIKFVIALMICGFWLNDVSLAQKNKTKSVNAPAKSQKTVEKSIKTTVIDEKGLAKIKQDALDAKKPLLINLWATWCAPCRDEFSDLVKIDEDFRSKGLQTVIISLDDLTELKTAVPQFLAEKNAQMPSYLLKSANENISLQNISKDWAGGLPFTVLFDADGKQLTWRQGKFKPEALRALVEKTLQTADAAQK